MPAPRSEVQVPPRPRHEIQGEFLNSAYRWMMDDGPWAGIRYVDDKGGELFPNDAADDHEYEVRLDERARLMEYFAQQMDVDVPNAYLVSAMAHYAAKHPI